MQVAGLRHKEACHILHGHTVLLTGPLAWGAAPPPQQAAVILGLQSGDGHSLAQELTCSTRTVGQSPDPVAALTHLPGILARSRGDLPAPRPSLSLDS